MSKASQPVSVRFTEKEVEILKAYCEQEGRTQTDVLREFVRSLKRKLLNNGVSNPIV